MSQTPAAERTRALSMLLLANFFWGLSFPVIKSVMLLHGRLLAACEHVVFHRQHGRSTIPARRGDHARAAAGGRLARDGAGVEARVILGLFAAAGMLFQNDGLQFTSASTSAFLTQFYAILIPVWVTLRARRNPGALVWTCCGLVLAGVAILGRFNWSELRFGRGEWETLLSSLFFMGQILTLERKDFAGESARERSRLSCSGPGRGFQRAGARDGAKCGCAAHPMDISSLAGV